LRHGSDQGGAAAPRGGIMAAMRSETFEFHTGGQAQVCDLTDTCNGFLQAGDEGLLNVFVPHATAGVAILETGAGSDEDLLATLADLLPADDRWQHRHGSPGHGRDHVLPALIAPYATVPVIAGRLQLGTWQSVCLVDTNVDNAVRTVRLSFVAG
jgi:secondary thiamine-phosphate synthase enzyme